MESSQDGSARIIDMHTHAQRILMTDAGYVAWMERVASVTRGRGVVRAWERFGYRPILANRLTTWASAPLTAFEFQLRDVIADPGRLRRSMRAAGVGRAVMLPIEPLGTSDATLACGRAFPELIPFVSVHPDRPAAADRLDALLASGGRGVKLHPVLQEVPAEARCWYPLLEAAASHGVPVLTHTGDFSYHVRRRAASTYASPARFASMLRSFPRQTIILGHTGLQQFEDAIDLARQHENAVVETSFQHRSRIRKALEIVGPDRVVFGSDWPASDPRFALREIRAAARSDAELERLLWGNAERLLGIPANG